VRELLALQASDWALLATFEMAGEYPRERMQAHAEALELAMAPSTRSDAGGAGPASSAALRNLATDLASAGWL
jgi:hypothetical protein